MKLAAALISAVLLLGAADAAGDTAVVSPRQIVKSKDGGLTVSVPRGALKKATKIGIRVLTRSQYPPELRDAAFRPGSKLYALEPAGLRFLKPVTITRRVDTKVSGFDPKDGLPVVVLTTRSTQGKWEILGNQRARLAGRTLVIQATTRHFSTLVSFDGSYRMTLVPSDVELAVGQTFTATVKTTLTSGQPSSQLDQEFTWNATGPVVVRVGNSAGTVGTFRCDRPGAGEYFVSIQVEDINLIVGAITLGARGYRYGTSLTGTARCKTAPPTQLELALACVLVAHSPLGPFPSFTRWLLQFARASLPASAQAQLTVGGVNNGNPISGAVSATTGKVELQGGISTFGSKAIQKLTVNGQDVTQQLIAKVGAAPTVTAAQGTIAGQCPP